VLQSQSLLLRKSNNIWLIDVSSQKKKKKKRKEIAQNAIAHTQAMGGNYNINARENM